MQKKLLVIGTALLLTALGVASLTGQKKAEAQMDTVPIFCNLAAMTPAQRQQYSQIKTRLRVSVQEVKELPDGYAFRYKPNPSVFMEAAEFVTLESRCCPFFSFTLESRHNGGPVWLRITGPKGAKPFIKEALAC